MLKYQYLSPLGNDTGPGVFRSISYPATVCDKIFVTILCVLGSESLWGTAIINLPHSLADCSIVYPPWWNTIQLNYLSRAQVWVLQKICQRNPKICTRIHSRLLKSNDPNHYQNILYFQFYLPFFCGWDLQTFFLFFSRLKTPSFAPHGKLIHTPQHPCD